MKSTGKSNYGGKYTGNDIKIIILMSCGTLLIERIEIHENNNAKDGKWVTQFK